MLFTEGQLYRVSNSVQQERDAARLPRDRPFPPKGDPGIVKQNKKLFHQFKHTIVNGIAL